MFCDLYKHNIIKLNQSNIFSKFKIISLIFFDAIPTSVIEHIGIQKEEEEEVLTHFICVKNLETLWKKNTISTNFIDICQTIGHKSNKTKCLTLIHS